MDWKNYLKPNTSKIIIAVILFVIFAPFIYYNNFCIDCIGSCGPSGPTSMLLFTINNFDGNNCVTFNSFDSVSFPILIISLAIAYILGILFGNLKIFQKGK